ncbi:MAG: GNAT family N-acetyltransferase, partial [Acetobacteraceae bacterium]|nr:GNAT family N-acetyltransferase [Acetobacteraceae bacterium]
MILRRATAADAAVVTEISTASRHAAMPTVRWAHTAEEDRAWVANVLLVQEEVWLAEADGVAAGFVALHEDWVSQLYLRPGWWRRGIGSALLDHAKGLRPGGLRLWCFQVNARGRAFYERHG